MGKIKQSRNARGFEISNGFFKIESALVIQMACAHSAAMAVLNRLGGAAGDRTVAAMASAAARLLRAYASG
jgi:hypothetical protein